MHTYNTTSRGTFEVGIFRPNGSWSVIKEVETEENAQFLVNKLNGGVTVTDPDFFDSLQHMTVERSKKSTTKKPVDKKPVETKDSTDGEENQ